MSLGLIVMPVMASAVPVITVTGVPVRLDDKVTQLHYRGQTLDLRVDRLTSEVRALLKKAEVDKRTISVGVVADAIEY